MSTMSLQFDKENPTPIGKASIKSAKKLSVNKLESKVANLSLRQSLSDAKIKRRALGDLLNTTKRQTDLKQSCNDDSDDKMQFKLLDDQIEEHECDYEEDNSIEHGPTTKYDSFGLNNSLSYLLLNTKSVINIPDGNRIPIFEDKFHRKHVISDKKQRKTIKKEAQHINDLLIKHHEIDHEFIINDIENDIYIPPCDW